MTFEIKLNDIWEHMLSIILKQDPKTEIGKLSGYGSNFINLMISSLSSSHILMISNLQDNSLYTRKVLMQQKN